MSSVMQFYHALPAPLRSVVASLRGYQLRWWRYGQDTDQLVAEAAEREYWSQSKWEAWRKERLAVVLKHAATRVPYYRNYWSKRRQSGDTSSWEDLRNWPVLEKDAIRSQPRAFLADDASPGRMFREHTSGTTGKPLDLWFSRGSVQAWYALVERRWRHWHGVDRDAAWAIIGGQLVTPVAQRQPPFWVWNSPLKQLYFSSYHLAPDLIRHYVAALERYRPSYMIGYSSSLFALASEIIRARLTVPVLKVVITNAEPLHKYQREAIADAFQSPVRETYGMCENVANASECEFGTLHLWPESGVIEVLQGDQPASEGSGDLVCTGLLNMDMPLIRYRVGDRSSLPSEVAPCKCGRTLPVLGNVEGRCDDVLFTRSGRKIGRLDPVFKANLPILEAQIVQTRLDEVKVRYVPAGKLTDSHRRALISRIQERLGEINVALEPLDEIPRGRNGKFRAVVCALPPDDLKALQRMNEDPQVPYGDVKRNPEAGCNGSGVGISTKAPNCGKVELSNAGGGE